MLQFTSDTIELKDGSLTREGQLPLAKSRVWSSIKESIDLLIPKENRSSMRVVDLGCLEGGYSIELAKMGFQVVGIDARQENIDKCNYAKERLAVELPNLTFSCDDVRNIAQYGQFDIILCYGLLYHLDKPVEFIKLLSQQTKSLLLLNTHYSATRDWRYDLLGVLNKYVLAPIEKRIKSLDYRANYRLSKVTKNEGSRGRWYREYNESASKNKFEKLLWASYGNHRSFWLDKKELTNTLNNFGFNHVFEQFNNTGDLIPEDYNVRNNRGMFVCLK